MKLSAKKLKILLPLAVVTLVAYAEFNAKHVAFDKKFEGCYTANNSENLIIRHHSSNKTPGQSIKIFSAIPGADRDGDILVLTTNAMFVKTNNIYALAKSKTSNKINLSDKGSLSVWIMASDGNIVNFQKSACEENENSNVILVN